MCAHFSPLSQVLFAGGYSQSNGAIVGLDAVDVYDLTTNTQSVATLSQPRSHLAAGSVNEIALFAGTVHTPEHLLQYYN